MRSWNMAPVAMVVAVVACGSGCGLLGDYDFDGYRRKDGPPVLQGGFVGGAAHGQAGGIELRGQIVWHGAVRSTPNAAGIELSGWLQ